MQIWLNGLNVELSSESTLAEFMLKQWPETPKGMAVAVNQQVIPRHNWESHSLHDQDKLLVIRPVQGG